MPADLDATLAHRDHHPPRRTRRDPSGGEASVPGLLVQQGSRREQSRLFVGVAPDDPADVGRVGASGLVVANERHRRLGRHVAVQDPVRQHREVGREPVPSKMRGLPGLGGPLRRQDARDRTPPQRAARVVAAMAADQQDSRGPHRPRGQRVGQRLEPPAPAAVGAPDAPHLDAEPGVDDAPAALAVVAILGGRARGQRVLEGRPAPQVPGRRLLGVGVPPRTPDQLQPGLRLRQGRVQQRQRGLGCLNGRPRVGQPAAVLLDEQPAHRRRRRADRHVAAGAGGVRAADLGHATTATPSTSSARAASPSSDAGTGSPASSRSTAARTPAGSAQRPARERTTNPSNASSIVARRCGRRRKTAFGARASALASWAMGGTDAGRWLPRACVADDASP